MLNYFCRQRPVEQSKNIMTRAGGQTSQRIIDRDYPHQVLVPDDNVRGKKLDEVIAVHKEIGAPMQSGSILKNDC